MYFYLKQSYNFHWSLFAFITIIHYVLLSYFIDKEKYKERERRTEQPRVGIYWPRRIRGRERVRGVWEKDNEEFHTARIQIRYGRWIYRCSIDFSDLGIAVDASQWVTKNKKKAIGRRNGTKEKAERKNEKNRECFS